MEGDKITIVSESTEKDGFPVYTIEISEKPEFMLDAEYTKEALECAINAVRSACRKVSTNPSQERTFAEYVIRKLKQDDIENTTMI